MAKKSKRRPLPKKTASASKSSVTERFQLSQIRMVKSNSTLEIKGGKPPQRTTINVTVECLPRRGDRDTLVNITCIVTAQYEPQEDPSIVIGCVFQAVYQVTTKAFPRIDDEGKAVLSGAALMQCWPFIRQFVQSTSAQMGLPGLTLPMMKLDHSKNQIATLSGVPIAFKSADDSD